MCWVRPGVFDAKARRLCCANALIADDLPALLRPTNAISGGPCSGSSGRRLAVTRNRAECAQARAAWTGEPACRSGRAMTHCKIRRFACPKPPEVDHMKSPLVLLLAAAVALPVVAAEPNAPAKPDPAKGETLSTQVCGACHTADGSRGSPA